jgi:flagellar biosynthesis protein FliQ
MDAATVLQLVSSMLLLTAKLGAPLLLTALVVGLLVSLFQAVTQINDATLGFLPKVVCVALALWVALPWLLQQAVAFTVSTFEMLERVPR